MPTPTHEQATTLTVGDHLLVIEPGNDQGGGQVIRLIGPVGAQALTIELTPQGPRLALGSGLTLALSGPLTIDAERVAIHGRTAVAITSGGELQVQAASDLAVGGRITTVTADLGDVKVKANDDVRLNGERIMMNC
jgi:hypothetical protein